MKSGKKTHKKVYRPNGFQKKLLLLQKHMKVGDPGKTLKWFAKHLGISERHYYRLLFDKFPPSKCVEFLVDALLEKYEDKK